MGLFDAIGDAFSDAADWVGDAVSDAADFVGDAASDAAGFVGDAAGFVGDAAEWVGGSAIDLFGEGFELAEDLLPFAAGALIPGFGLLPGLGVLDDVAKPVLDFVGDILRPGKNILDPVGDILDDIFNGIDRPGQTESDDINLKGLDIFTILFLLMSRVEKQQQGTVEALDALSKKKEKIDNARVQVASGNMTAEQFEKQFGGPEFQGLDSGLRELTAKVQQLESYRQQLTTMISNMQRADHETKMVTLRNIPTR